MAKRNTPEQQKKHWENYLKSGLSQKDYANQNGISRASLNNWGAKYSKELGRPQRTLYTDQQIESIIEEFQASKALRPTKILNKYGISMGQFEKWFKKFRGSKKAYYKSLHLEHLKRFSESGMTKQEYAKQYDIHADYLNRWEKQYVQ